MTRVQVTVLVEQGFVPSGLALFTTTGRVTTAAGMASAADAIVSLIVTPRSARLAQAVGKSF